MSEWQRYGTNNSEKLDPYDPKNRGLTKTQSNQVTAYTPKNLLSDPEYLSAKAFADRYAEGGDWANGIDSIASIEDERLRDSSLETLSSGIGGGLMANDSKGWMDSLSSFDTTKGWGGAVTGLANLGLGYLDYKDKHAMNKLNLELGKQKIKNNQNAQIARDNTVAVFNAHGNKPTKTPGIKPYKTL